MHRLALALLLWLVGLSALLAAAPAAAAPAQEWNLRVQTGDTLIGIAQRFLREPYTWQALQRHNTVRNANFISPGSTLRIPVQWMRGEPATAAVLYVQGEATVSAQPEASPAAARPGDNLPEGARLRTGANSAMTLRFVDGSQVVVTPQTDVTLEQMQVFPATGGFTSTRLNLQRGAVESQVQPQRDVQRSYEIRTPVVTLGVRGTVFRSAAGDAGSRVEVVSGAVQASASRTAAVNAGEGVVTSATGQLGNVVQLLPAPQLLALPATPDAQGATPLQWQAVAGSGAYRVQVLAAEQDSLLRDGQWPGPQALLQGLPAGNYRLRVRGISADGLEGLDAQTPWQLTAYVPPPPAGPPPPQPAQPENNQRALGNHVTLAWYAVEPGRRYRVQVATDAAFANRVLDQTTAAPATYNLEQVHLALPPGGYHWRVASVGPGGEVGPYAPARRFELATGTP